MIKNIFFAFLFSALLIILTPMPAAAQTATPSASPRPTATPSATRTPTPTPSTSPKASTTSANSKLPTTGATEVTILCGMIGLGFIGAGSYVFLKKHQS